MANSWSNTFQSSLTLPTGATSGARIVLDGTNDEILVYNSAGQLVDTIGGPNGAITIGPAGGAQVILQQQSGLGTIFFPTGNSHERSPAQINSGVANQNMPTEYLAFTFTGASVTTATDFIRFQINTQAEDGSSNANFEFVTVHSNNLQSAIMTGDDSQVNFFGNIFVANDQNIGGFIFRNGSVPVTIGSGGGAPAFTAGWSGGTTWTGNSSSIAIESLNYYRLPDGTVKIKGMWQSGGTVPSLNAVFTLPSGFYSTSHAQPFVCYAHSTSTNSTGVATVTGNVMTNGAFQLSSNSSDTNSYRAANVNLWVDVTIYTDDIYNL